MALALFDGHHIVAEETLPAQRLHTVELAPAVDRMLRAAGIRPADIRAVGVAEGPGSYTALRIGIAFALGFALPRSLPVVGIPTFDILVHAQPVIDKDLVAVLRAGRNRIGCCMYHAVGGKWKASGDALVLSWEELAANAPRRARICGEIDRAGKAALAKRRDLRFAPPHRNARRAGALAEMTAERLRDPATRPMILQPIYLNSAPVGTGA